MPRVSIITPAYNHAGYIGECIASVIAGAFQDWEMLVVDDGSTDVTAEVVESIVDPRVRLLRKENGGIMKLAEGYNLALGEAKGDLIAILEGDDYWPLNKLEIQVPEFDDPSVVLVSGFTQIVNDAAEDLGRIPAEPLSESVRDNRPLGAATRAMISPYVLTFAFPVATMFRRSALERIGGFRQPADLPLVDYPTILSIGLEGEFRFVAATCGYWRRHPQSTTKSRFSEILEGCYRDGMRILKEEGSRLDVSDDEIEAIEKVWEDFQAKRCIILGRLLDDEKRYKEASKAFRLAARYRQSRRSDVVSKIARWVTALGLPIGWLYRLAYPRTQPEAWREAMMPGGDLLVKPSDLDRPWFVYRRGMDDPSR